MAVSIWCEFVCCHCSTAAAGRHVYGGKIPIKDMKVAAAKEGWMFDKDEAYCGKFCFNAWTGRPLYD